MLPYFVRIPLGINYAPAHVSIVSRRRATFSAASHQDSIPCEKKSAAQVLRFGRRSLSIAIILFHSPTDAYAGNIFDKYVKRKKLEPLEAYVPAVLLTRSQFLDLEKTLENDQPKYATSRSLLRSGPAASLRVNIRAVAQYASDNGRGKDAFNAVDQCLGALEDLDSLMLHASRNDSTATVESMKAKINVALGAMDSLLQTVPPSVLDKGKLIADSYNSPSSPEDFKPEELDPDLKQLEELL